MRDTVDAVLQGRLRRIETGSEESSNALVKVLRGLGYDCAPMGTMEAAPDFFSAGDQNQDGAEFDLSSLDGSDDDIMALLEEESRKTGTSKAITPEDLARATVTERAVDPPPLTGMVVDDESSHQRDLLDEWNRTTKQRAIRPEDLLK